jgi:ABC-2 type transport system permease protein
MVAKELRLIVKDKVALFLIFLLPAALIGMLWWVGDMSETGGMSLGGPSIGTGDGGNDNATEDGSGIIIGLIDQDTTRTYDGEDLSENFTAFVELIVDEIVLFNNSEDAFNALYNQEIDGFIVIPDGFEANLTINEPTYIEMHVDSTDLIGQSIVQGVVQGSVIAFRASKLWIISEVFPNIVTEFVPEGSSLMASFGGFIVVFSSYLGIAMTAAQSIVGDIPLRRMLLTPTNRLEVIVAKALGYVVIGFFQSLLLISLWVIVFDLNLNTGFESLIIIMSLTSLTGSTTGILISSVAGTRLQANQMFLFVMFATVILSGYFIDVGFLNEVLPMNLGLNVLIATAFKGLTLLDVWRPIVTLLGFSIAAVLASSYIFSKKPTLD